MTLLIVISGFGQSASLYGGALPSHQAGGNSKLAFLKLQKIGDFFVQKTTKKCVPYSSQQV